MSVSPEHILAFWFEEIDPGCWWVKDPVFDQTVAERFGTLLEQAKQGELYHWRSTPKGRLAEVIVLDQFSRNIYRDSPMAFEADPMALILAQEAVAHHAEEELSPPQIQFLYMPFMHSESKAIHEKALMLFSRESVRDNLDFELRHKAIVDRFGRYPHRNKILGRKSTTEEIEFLRQPGPAF
ncbi:MAG: DUF924 domain-containing protein [Shewanella sp.]|nr:DUF924 domain-containing protein [Shewanella sp.]MCF1432124.1 DUF924 domain-containing protein [Shewanella sp.]MCF1439205.1 DUF924 domain-containing protein [Shewanella sp.]MCF1457820.1 DUF924 domain-containing protein [Shewanella sp.]